VTEDQKLQMEDLKRALIDAHVAPRNIDITLLRVQGLTLEAIGQKYRRTREWARLVLELVRSHLVFSGHQELFSKLLAIQKENHKAKHASWALRTERHKLMNRLKELEVIDYQEIYRSLDIKPRTDQPLTGAEAAEQIFRDFRIKRSGPYYLCVLCKKFFFKDEFMPSSLKEVTTQRKICKRCNALVQTRYRLQHPERFKEVRREYNRRNKERVSQNVKRSMLRQKLGIRRPRKIYEFTEEELRGRSQR